MDRTVPHFQEELEALQARLLEMGGLAEERVRAAVHGLVVRDPAFIDMLRERNMAVVFADSDEFPCIDEQTADFTYARLQRSQEDIATGYDAKALDAWAKRAKDWAEGDRDVYIFFISGAKVRNPAAAQALIAKLR